MRKLTNKEFIEKLKQKKIYDEYLPITEYKTASEPIIVKHLKCGKTFKTIPNKLLQEKGCPYCAKNHRYNEEEIKEKIKALPDGAEYSLLSRFKNTKEKSKFYHSICGNTFEMRIDDFIQGQRYPFCAKSKRKQKKMAFTTKSFNEEVNKITNGEYNVVGNYNGLHKHTKIKHNLCGCIFDVDPYNFLSRETRCPNCSHGHKIKAQEEIEREIHDIDPAYKVIGKYNGTMKPLKVRHEVCGNEFNIYPENFIYKGNRCPFCSYKAGSSPEKEILDFIKSIYTEEIKQHFRLYPEKNKRKFKEIDIYLPELKIGFEYNGIYWHSEAAGKSKAFHYEKYKFFKDNGITLIQIFEDEFKNNKKEILKKIADVINKEYKPNNLSNVDLCWNVVSDKYEIEEETGPIPFYIDWKYKRYSEKEIIEQNPGIELTKENIKKLKLYRLWNCGYAKYKKKGT